MKKQKTGPGASIITAGGGYETAQPFLDQLVTDPVLLYWQDEIKQRMYLEIVVLWS